MTPDGHAELCPRARPGRLAACVPEQGVGSFVRWLDPVASGRWSSSRRAAGWARVDDPERRPGVAPREQSGESDCASTLRSEDLKLRQDSVTRLLTVSQWMKGKQDSMDPILPAVKQRTSPCGGSWLACSRGAPGLRKRFIGSSRCSSGWRGPTGTAGDENDPSDAEDGSSAHPKPQDGQQYSLEQVHYSP